jgi:hypothetical protein
MKHKGVEFVILTRPGRNQWTVAIYCPGSGQPSESQFEGSGDRAIAAARAKIERQLRGKGARLAHVIYSNRPGSLLLAVRSACLGDGIVTMAPHLRQQLGLRRGRRQQHERENCP